MLLQDIQCFGRAELRHVMIGEDQVPVFLAQRLRHVPRAIDSSMIRFEAGALQGAQQQEGVGFTVFYKEHAEGSRKCRNIGFGIHASKKQQPMQNDMEASARRSCALLRMWGEFGETFMGLFAYPATLSVLPTRQ